MDHSIIEERNVAELYAARQLPPEEETLFEEHLIECAECRERVARAEDLRGSFQAMAVEDRTRAAVGIGLFAWLARHQLAARLGLAALLLLALGLPAWLLVQQGRLRRELDLARAEAARSHPPAAAEAPSRPEDPFEGERRRLEGQLQAEIQETEGLKKRLAEIARPQVNTAIFSLGMIRGEGERTNRVRVGPKPEWIVLAIEAPEAGPETWRATLLDSTGRTVWRGEGLRPTANDELVLGLYSDLLAPGAPGDYRLRLEAMPAQGRAAREIPFRVERRR
jgi:hypothetical protein